MPSWFSTPAQRYRLILIVALLALALFVLIAAWTALLPFFMGLILAYVLMPAVNFFDQHMPRFLRRTKWSRRLAIIIVYVLAIAFASGVLSYFVPVIIEQAETLIRVAPTYLEKIEGLLTYDFEPLIERIPPQIQDTVRVNLEKAAGTLVDAIPKGLSVTISAVSQTVSFVLGMVIIPFWLSYVLNDESEVRRTFYQMIPESAREDVHSIALIIDELLSRYIRGQAILCFVVGAMVTIVLLVLGVDLAILLGTLAGIFEMIPILGPYLGAFPAVLLALLTRPILALWVAVAFAAIQQIENIFLVPRISGNAVRFHPAVVMVLVVVGSEIAGLWGLLVAVPVAAVIRDVFRYLYLRTTERGATPEMALEILRARSL